MLFKLARILLYAAMFAPVVVTTSTVYPAVVGPDTWFKCAIGLALVCFFIGVTRDQREAERYRARAHAALTSPLGVAVSAFVAAFLLACVAGIDRTSSFWSNFERGQGGVEIVTLYLFFLLLVTLLDGKDAWAVLLRCFVVAALLSVAYGVLAGLGVEGLGGGAFDVDGYRFAGSLSNSAVFGGYALFAIGFALQLAVAPPPHPSAGHGGTRRKSTRKPPPASAGSRGAGARGWPAAAAALPVAIFLIALLFAAQRGDIAGLLVGTLVFSLSLAWSRPAWRRRILGACGVALASVVALALLRGTALLQRLPFARLLDVSFASRSFADRSGYWRMAWQGFLQRPLLGFGPENLLVWFQRDFNVAIYKPPELFWGVPDRAHNVLFDYLGATGIVGTLAYLSMFAAYFWTVARTEKPAGASAAQRALLLALPAAYLGQGMAMFDNLPVLLGLFVTFAFALHRALDARDTAAASGAGLAPRVAIGALGAAVGVALMVVGAIVPFRKAQLCKGLVDNGAAFASVDALESTIDRVLELGSPVAWRDSVGLALKAATTMADAEHGQPEVLLRDLVAHVEPKALPDDVQHHLDVTGLRLTLASRFFRRVDYDAAIAHLTAVRRVAPSFPAALYGLFKAYRIGGNAAGMREVGADILARWPDDTSVREALAKLDGRGG
jgi:O-antigen ligase